MSALRSDRRFAPRCQVGIAPVREDREPRVMTLGETGVLLDPVTDGGVELGALFRLRVSGSESNFAIGLRRLGIPVTWVSRLGADPMGDLVLRTLDAEGVDLDFVVRDAEAPTAATFKIRNEGATRLAYYRRGSAASRMAPGDVPEAALDGAGVVHLTGITMALGTRPMAVVLAVARRARRRGATVTFDLNYRPALWSPDAAAAAIRMVLPRTDWVMCGEDEARLLFGGDDAAATVDRLFAAGARRVVLRIGEAGALVARDGNLVHVPAFEIGRIADDIGAGDAFDAGFVYGLICDLGPERSARVGNLLASRALSGTGDWETLPRLDEIQALLSELIQADESDPWRTAGWQRSRSR